LERRNREYMQNIIIRPIITEKSMKDVQAGKCTFEVFSGANKDVIKLAVEQSFGVTVLRVGTTMVKGRSVRTGRKRIVMRKQPWKKAIVLLKPGQKIDLFDIGA